jgi:hypothetical protein
MAADTPQDMSLERRTSVRALVKALGTIAARLRRVSLDDEKQSCRELTEILHAVRAIANAVASPERPPMKPKRRAPVVVQVWQRKLILKPHFASRKSLL